jgi:acetyl-CoA synthetase
MSLTRLAWGSVTLPGSVTPPGSVTRRGQRHPARVRGSGHNPCDGISVVNFAVDVVERAHADGVAIVELTRAGERRCWSFGEVAQRSAGLSGTLRSLGVKRGEVVMTLIGNRSEWVFAMLACFRIGAVVLPCSEQLRAKDLSARIDAVAPAAILADERNRAELEAAGVSGARGGEGIPVLLIPDERLFDASPAPAAQLAADDLALITFTSGTAGEPKPVLHAQRYLFGQRLQGRHWLSPPSGGLVWCTAASGWSKSARNVFIAPWLMGARALLHDARFDPQERLQILAQERVDVLCMAPTEYRIIARRATLAPLPSVKGLVAAGEALDPEVLRAWRDATGLAIRDGYGQTETGQLTANPAGSEPRPGSMGLPLPGVSLSVDDGELVLDPQTVPTFFVGYLGEQRHAGRWRTGDRVRIDDDGYIFFEGRADDVIISAGYRIGPSEVESALVSHPAVAEAAAVSAPDPERGEVVRAVVVLRDGRTPSELLARELQDHVKSVTAPYKYPRIVDFVGELPKTSSGKVRRALLREQTLPG